MKKAYAFLAEGFEEVEALAVIDVLRRADIDMKMVSINNEKAVTGSHGITIMADELFADIKEDDADLYFLPGGLRGTNNLGSHEELCTLLKEKFGAGRHIAAVCAAPSVLGKLGILHGKKATCYPGFEDKLTGATVLTEDRSKRVVTDSNVTTSRGMGTSIELGLELVSILVGKETSDHLAMSIQHI